jgi:hypothetical protein
VLDIESDEGQTIARMATKAGGGKVVDSTIWEMNFAARPMVVMRQAIWRRRVAA